MWNSISRFLPSWSIPKPTDPPVGDINDPATPGHCNSNDGLQTPNNAQSDTPHDSDRHSTCSGGFEYGEGAMASSTQTLVNPGPGVNNNGETRGVYTNEHRHGYGEPEGNYDRNTMQLHTGRNDHYTAATRHGHTLASTDSGLGSTKSPLSDEVDNSEPPATESVSDAKLHPKRVGINDRGHAFTSGNKYLQQNHRRIMTGTPNSTPNRPEDKIPLGDNNLSRIDHDMTRIGQSVGLNHMGHVFTMENERVEQNRVDIDLSGVKDPESIKAIVSMISANRST